MNIFENFSVLFLEVWEKGILGIDIFRSRMRDAIKVLGGISKKKEKILLSEYQSLS